MKDIHIDTPILTTDILPDYELMDSGNGERLERFGKYIVSRPDPQVIWSKKEPKLWQPHTAYTRTQKDKGFWKNIKDMPEEWPFSYRDVRFHLRCTPFKHVGLFPEQAIQWEWMRAKIKNNTPKILNLFAYTGGATIALAAAGAQVTHVDASKPSITWARNNQHVSGLQDKPIRWILEDVMTFVKREVKRGNKYDGIIMDPPVYGHGPNGEVWDFPKSFPELIDLTSQLLSPQPLFIVVNAYAVSISSLTLANILTEKIQHTGATEAGELLLQDRFNRVLSTGIYARWTAH